MTTIHQSNHDYSEKEQLIQTPVINRKFQKIKLYRQHFNQQNVQSR